jgi:anaerobic magnesium-protoporphyrin IX monomethyl ester cyclase
MVSILSPCPGHTRFYRIDPYMKIAFINPPLSLLRHEKFMSPDPWFPLGLGYMAAYLRRGGHAVRILDPDAAGLPVDAMWAELSAFRPDAVGITSTTMSFMVARQLVPEAKRRLNCLVLMGGPHTGALPRSTLLGTPGLDAVIRGEGEIPMLALAAEFDASGKVDFNAIPGAAFLEDGVYKETPLPELLPDLDILPYPARDLLDMRPYERCKNLYSKEKMATLISSRGCPSQCNFCANPQGMGRRFRPRRPEHVVEEMEHLIEKYGVRHFYIVDDCFSIDGNRAAEICDLMIKRGLRATWQAAGRVNTLLNDSLIEKMKQAGCVEVLLGIETGSERLLNIMRKGTSLAMAKECCAKLHKHGISCYNSFILGAEGETFATMLSTFIFSKRLSAMFSVFNILVPFPGTPVFEKYYKDFDRPDTDWTDWASLFHRRPYPPRHTALPWGVQKGFMWTASLLYYLDPFQMLRMIIKLV